MPTSRATTSNAVLLGGSNRATALSLNVCPYRAICVFHRRPQVLGFIEATTILTRGGTLKEENEQLKRELVRKEKALSEAAALLILQKKFRALWEDEVK
jgi:hypothetical protein